MTHAENMAKLRTYLKEDTDPQLLAFVSEPTTIHNLLNMALGQFCVAAGIDQHQAMAFFKAFGANSFLGFKRVIRECLYSESFGDGLRPRSTTSIASEIIRNEIQNLGDFWHNLDCVGIDRLARDIHAAREVWLFGQGASGVYIKAFSHILRIAKIPFRIADMQEEDMRTLQQTPAHDRPLVIAFSFFRYSKQVQMRLRAVKQLHTPLVCITDRDNSPAAAIGDYYFTLPVRSFDFTDSFCAGMTFFNILAVTLTTLDRERAFDLFQEREIRLDENNMFL